MKPYDEYHEVLNIYLKIEIHLPCQTERHKVFEKIVFLPFYEIQ